jgi:hypothetical protein
LYSRAALACDDELVCLLVESMHAWFMLLIGNLVVSLDNNSVKVLRYYEHVEYNAR